MEAIYRNHTIRETPIRLCLYEHVPSLILCFSPQFLFPASVCVCVCVTVYMCLRERERERQRECVCVFERERETLIGSVNIGAR